MNFKRISKCKLFLLNPVINLSEEERWMLTVTSFEATNSILNINHENNSFSISIPGRCRIPNCFKDGIIDKLRTLLKLRYQSDIELPVEEDRKRCYRIKIKSKESSSSDFDTVKKEILEELKSADCHELEDIFYRMRLTYDEFLDVLDTRFFPSERTGYTLPPGIYETSDINKTLE